MALFKLMAAIGADGSELAAVMKTAKHQAKELKHSFEEIGTEHLKSHIGAIFGVAAITAATEKTVEYGSKIVELSERLDVSKEDLQKWDFALTQNGSTLEAGVTFLEKLGKARKAALSGNEDMIESFRSLGVSVDDLKSKNLQTIGLKIGDAVKNGDIQKLGAALKEVGGRGAGELVPAMKAGLEDAFTAAEKLNIILSDGTVEALHEIGKSAGTVARQLRAVLGPTFVWVTEKLKDAYDFFAMITGVEAIGAMIGAKAGGASSSEARKAGNEQYDKALERYKDRHAPHAPGEHAGKVDLEEGGAGDAYTNKTAVREAEKQLKLRDRLEEITRKNNLSELSTTERVNELIKQREALLTYGENAGTENEIKAEELRGQINELTRKKAVALNTDEMAKRGGFLGNAFAMASTNPTLDIAKQSLATQKNIEKNTAPKLEALPQAGQF